ncbi:helix-turn-helix domain-containing protein [Actinoplanes sp. KI2]|uniref:CPBP family glutamic-type intramembrane protease n=1 Tax=Actinoplanes sp. KI2 TaxID=2983315 RepID=UPI0021D5A0FB|nr:CPBP family glutamic-type intramembrane protease [Actinoplanes sp. KI2]MCU7730852.1 helix-turn-helix domain-containing protein [Actinoplanes sp. KI2]
MAPAVATGAALVVSQSMFALYHLPGEVLGGSSGAGMGWPDIGLDLGRLFAIGMVFAALYLRTGNLFLVIGIHALQDAGTTIVAAPVDPGLAMLRAAVLRAIEAPCTTTELARRAGTSVTSASQHAAVLRKAGLITTVRRGGAVVHSLTNLGTALLP